MATADSLMVTADSLTAPFFDNPQYSDIIIKFGEHQIRAHKVILAQQSGYFATAFFSRFQVASNPVIDLGDEDDPELLTDTIRYLYRHGRLHDQLQDYMALLSIDGLIDIYQLADKYDIPDLRISADAMLYSLASSDFRRLSANSASLDSFLDCVARVCGPNSLQFADNTLKTTVLEVCQKNCVPLFQNKLFLKRYTGGEVFDVESAAAFGMGLGSRLLKSNGMAADEADGFPSPDHDLKVFPGTERNHMINFFNDERFSDIVVTYSGQKILAHKVFLATHSSYFQKLLEGSPTTSEIDLGSEHDLAATAAFLEHMYSADDDSAYYKTPMVLAEMYLVAVKHGRHDVADDYETFCYDQLTDETFSNQYFSDVAALCGPDSSRYADTSLPDMAFGVVLRKIKHMDDKDTEKFKEKFDEGMLFNAKFMQRFGRSMLDRYRELYKRSPPPRSW